MLSDGICDHIRKLVRSRLLGPQDVLNEVPLAEELGVSRTPVRTALVRLTDAGLLQKLPGRGWGVRPLAREDIEEIFQMKIALETLAVRMAAEHITTGASKRLLELVEDMERTSSDEDLETWLRQDEAFHSLIMHLAGNGRLEESVGELNDQWYRLRPGYLAMSGRLSEATAEHRRLAEAIASGDGDTASEEALKHLEHVHVTVKQVMETILPFVGGNHL